MKTPDIETIYSQYTRENCNECTLCGLSQSRTNTVWSRGQNARRLMIVGEAPGQTEDKLALPFIGDSGKLLQNMLASIQIDPELDCYVCNVVKCRPPDNRQPSAKEASKCFGYLAHQIAETKPLLILALGATSAKFLIDERPFSISKHRGRFYPISKKFELIITANYNENYNLQVIPTFHPSLLLRENKVNLSPGSNRWLVWQDMLKLRKELERVN